MAYKTLNLTSTTVKNLKPEEKMYRIKDTHTRGLHIEVATSGSKFWRYKYKFHKCPRMMTLGKYPKVSLSQARAEAHNHLDTLYSGKDPKQKSIARVNSNKTFEEVFYEWYKFKTCPIGKKKWSSYYSKNVLGRVKLHLLPKLGQLPVTSIDTRVPMEILARLNRDGKMDTLYKIKDLLNRIFKYCIREGIIKTNPLSSIEKGTYDPNESEQYPAPTEPKEIGNLLSTIDKCKNGWQVRKALELIPLIFLRVGALVQLEWNEIDFNEKKIYFPKHKDKKRRAFIIPMSAQVIEILKELKSINTGSNYVFPRSNDKNKHIAPNSLLQSIRRVGITKEQFVIHGFRTIFSTLANEEGYRSDAIEMQLNHVEKNKSRAPYNRAKYLEERIKMMQWYSDYILELKSNATGYIC